MYILKIAFSVTNGYQFAVASDKVAVASHVNDLSNRPMSIFIQKLDFDTNPLELQYTFGPSFLE